MLKSLCHVNQYCDSIVEETQVEPTDPEQAFVACVPCAAEPDNCYDYMVRKLVHVQAGIDEYLETVSQEGSKAFTYRDLMTVKNCCVQSVLALSFQNKMVGLARAWSEMKYLADVLLVHESYDSRLLRLDANDPAALSKASIPLLDAMDLVMQTVINRGMQAFATFDFSEAESLSRHAARLVDYKEQLESAIDKCSQ